VIKRRVLVVGRSEDLVALPLNNNYVLREKLRIVERSGRSGQYMGRAIRIGKVMCSSVGGCALALH
jgi:hypothetical protein